MKILLTGGYYQAQTVIADAQQCLNLYPEINPQNSTPPAPTTHYQTPGTRVWGTDSLNAPVRCLFRASNGDLYVVIGTAVYFVNKKGYFSRLGHMVSGGNNPVSMQDNGIIILIVDDSVNGYVIDLVTREFGQVKSTHFFGGTVVDYVNSYFILNVPTTNRFYISLGNITFSNATNYTGAIISGSITGGTGYTNGTYTGISLSETTHGALGNDALANITVVGGSVYLVDLINTGEEYIQGDVLVADNALIGGGSGFLYTVESVNSGGFVGNVGVKDTYPDPISTLRVMHGEIWLVGTLTSEVWYDTGSGTQPFARMPGVNVIEHGTIAPYSMAKQDYNLYWLSSDEQGNGIVVRGSVYNAYNIQRISTHAIETQLANYPTLTDAIGFTYQQHGHTFYILIFPSANTTWAFDESTQLWHERAWLDSDGNLNRIRANCYASAYEKDLVGDWQNGDIYEMSLDLFTDAGNPIPRIRSFPHIVNEGKRISYKNLILDVEVGTDTGAIDGADSNNPPVVNLSWSDDRGQTFNNPLPRSVGAAGQYNLSVKWSRLGSARDRVFKISYSIPARVAIQQAWIEIEEAGS